jgi:hypothetical protein
MVIGTVVCMFSPGFWATIDDLAGLDMKAPAIYGATLGI